MRNQETASDSTMTKPNAVPRRKYGRSMSRITAAATEAPGTFPPDRPRKIRTPPGRMRVEDQPRLRWHDPTCSRPRSPLGQGHDGRWRQLRRQHRPGEYAAEEHEVPEPHSFPVVFEVLDPARRDG